jgi:glycine cleavage system transcriptional repressor
MLLAALMGHKYSANQGSDGQSQESYVARPTSNENYILIAAVAPQDKSPLMPLTKRISECGCTLVESRLSALGTHVSVSLLAMGSWDAVAKLEASTARIERDEGIKVHAHRTLAKPMQTDLLPYVIEVVAADKPGIMFQLAEFFSHHGISIESLTSSRFRAMQTGAEMFSAQITIGIPSKTHIAGLRDDFLEFCDSLNLDAIMDPMKF